MRVCVQMKKIMYPVLSFVWSVASGCKRAMMSSRAEKIPHVLVVGVGNIQVGGSGKTPLIECLAKKALEKGHRVAILCRGYRSRWESTGGVLAPYQTDFLVKDCGDEAALLHQMIPQAWIGVGKKRKKSWNAIQKKAVLPPTFLLLDDAFQNYSFFKNKNIVLVTSRKISEMIFRDFSWSLKKADIILWTKGNYPPEFLKKWNLSAMPFLCEMIPGKEKVFLISGVADPFFLKDCVVQAGYTVIHHVCLPDHVDYTLTQIKKWEKEAEKKQGVLATTLKDAVKWKDCGFSLEKTIVLKNFYSSALGDALWSQIF